MATGQDLINASLRKINVLSAGESPDGQEGVDALAELNRMLEEWRLDSLMTFAITREVFNLVASDGSYTIGSGGDFNTTRPVKIEEAGLLVDPSATNPNELPLDIVNYREWSAIRIKSIESALPQVLWYNPTIASSLGTINLYPVPSTATPDLVLYMWQPIAALTLAGTVTLPPGYESAIVYNLAERLADDYGRSVPIHVEKLAAKSIARIKRMNRVVPELKVDAALRSRSGGYDIRTNSFQR